MSSRDYADAADSLSAILKKELTQYSRKGYLDPSDPTVVTAADRKSLVDWCYCFADHYDLSRETVATAMEMVDRFLSISAGPFAIWDANSDVAKVGNNALHCQIKFQLLAVRHYIVPSRIRTPWFQSMKLLKHAAACTPRKRSSTWSTLSRKVCLGNPTTPSQLRIASGILFFPCSSHI